MTSDELTQALIMARPRLLAAYRRYLHGKGLYVDEEDVFQEISRKALPMVGRLASNASLFALLLRMGVNYILSLLRHETRHRSFDPALPPAPSGLIVMPGQLAGLQQAEARQALRAAINQLTRRQQEIVRLRYLEERSIEDIAGQLRITPGSVSVKLCQARKSLEKLLNPLMAPQGLREEVTHERSRRPI